MSSISSTQTSELAHTYTWFGRRGEWNATATPTLPQRASIVSILSFYRQLYVGVGVKLNLLCLISSVLVD